MKPSCRYAPRHVLVNWTLTWIQILVWTEFESRFRFHGNVDRIRGERERRKSRFRTEAARRSHCSPPKCDKLHGRAQAPATCLFRSHSDAPPDACAMRVDRWLVADGRSTVIVPGNRKRVITPRIEWKIVRSSSLGASVHSGMRGRTCAAIPRVLSLPRSRKYWWSYLLWANES